MYRGQLFQDDPVKCHKQKEIMDLSDLATGRSEGSLAAILLTDVSRAITLVENWESGSMRAMAILHQLRLPNSGLNLRVAGPQAGLSWAGGQSTFLALVKGPTSAKNAEG